MIYSFSLIFTGTQIQRCDPAQPNITILAFELTSQSPLLKTIQSNFNLRALFSFTHLLCISNPSTWLQVAAHFSI